jgi:hypothetical protein
MKPDKESEVAAKLRVRGRSIRAECVFDGEIAVENNC